MKIYIVLTYTGTVLSRIIKIFKRSEYAHVSISLNDDLTEMYSFGRLNPYNAFIGGFVHESTENGTFKRFKNTKSMILEVNINEYKYNKIKRIISDFNKDSKYYKFNIIGLFLTALNIRVVSRNKFYCAEFVKYVLDEADCSHNLPAIATPDDFIKYNDSRVVYEGLLKNYDTQKKIAV